jgi:hypothetical protein
VGGNRERVWVTATAAAARATARREEKMGGGVKFGRKRCIVEQERGDSTHAREGELEP